MTKTNRADFERFARSEMDSLLRYATMLTGDRELARDIVQDVMVKAYERWPKIGSLNRPRAYVRTMITTTFLSWRRRWSVRNITFSDELRPPPTIDHAEGIAARAEMWQRLATLPRQQRAVLVLRFYERLSDSEIASVLNCTVGTVRGYASKGLATLRLSDEPDAEAHRAAALQNLLTNHASTREKTA